MIKDRLEKILGFEIEATENSDFGDYSSNIALQHEYRVSSIGSPRQNAEAIVEKLKTNKKLLSLADRIEIAGPGFINFWLRKDVLVDNLLQIASEKEKFGISDIGRGKTVVIDYSSPNIAKSFGIGHLRSTIIGQALYNLYRALGYEVVGDNHLGDWGTQFGKLLYMIDKEKLKKFDIARLEELYIEFHQLAEKDPDLEEKAREWFKKLEEGDPTAKSIWQKCVDVSVKEFNRIYDILGVKIDFAFGESYYEGEMRGLMNDARVQRFIEAGEDGAEIIELSQFGIKTPLMFLKKDGTTTYATRDLATIKFRVRKWNPDLIIYEVGVEQTLHFRQVFAAARLLNLVNDSVELIHTAHGLYLAPDGKKFSTRKGKTIKLEEVLDEAIARAKKLGSSTRELAKQVGIGAIKYYDLMHAVQSDVVFDWEKMMNLEGNSGPYLQYTVARCNSVLAKSDKSLNKLENGKWQMENEELTVLRSLIRFPEIISMSAKMYSPNLLCSYLYDLAQKYNSFYNKDKIIGSDNEEFRLALTNGVGQVLKNGLAILGIQAPERM